MGFVCVIYAELKVTVGLLPLLPNVTTGITLVPFFQFIVRVSVYVIECVLELVDTFDSTFDVTFDVSIFKFPESIFVLPVLVCNFIFVFADTKISCELLCNVNLLLLFIFVYPFEFNSVFDLDYVCI
jgi:hypothetical protein